jgi:hypothetical protein
MNAKDSSSPITTETSPYRSFRFVRVDEMGFWVQHDDRPPVCIPATAFMAICRGIVEDDRISSADLRLAAEKVASVAEYQALLWT